MKWIRDNTGRVVVIAVVIFMLITISVSSTRIGNDSVNDTAPELAVQRLTADAQSGFSKLFGNIGDFFSGVIHYKDYQDENEKLKQENAELKEELSNAQLSEKELSELQNLSETLNYSDYSSDYDKVSADVISLDSSGVFGNLTISVGKNDGVEKGSFVINEDGLVGKVSSVTGGTAKVSGIIDSTVSVSFYDQSDTNVIGLVTGDGSGNLEGYLFDAEKTIEKGAVLMTSGLGSYPGGIEIGTVTKVSTDKSTGQLVIEAEPAVDFYSTKIVTVLTSKN